MNEKTLHEMKWLTVGIEKILPTIPVDAKSLLDVGCGYGLTGFFCRAYRNMDRTVGIDGFQDCINFCEKHDLYDDTRLMDLNQTHGLLPFTNSEFDVAFCSEVVEHLPKNVAIGLIGELKRVGKFVIVTTPAKFALNPLLDNNPYQSHKCIITVNEFRELGFRVIGMGALNLRFLPNRIQYLMSPWSSLFPRYSQIVLATTH